MSLLQDWDANQGNPKARVILLAFRLAGACRRLPKPWLYLTLPYLIAYRIGVEWILGVELPWKLQVGPGLKLFHGTGLVVNDRAVLGRDVILRHCTTIGVKETQALGQGAAPVIGDGVDIGSNVVILGAIRVGSGARIGAGSVVVRDVPAGATVVGNPARVIGAAKSEDRKQ
jgi:putative colanic acid biosynthesis acetyltransferase WcaB